MIIKYFHRMSRYLHRKLPVRMFRTLILLLFIYSSDFSNAQEAASFEKLVKETQDLFRIYESLSPFGEMYPLNALGLTKKEIRAIREGGDSLELSEKKDSVESYMAIGIIQEKITDRLKKLIVHPDFWKHDIKKLLAVDYLGVVKSEDNKLLNFSYDAKNGGTYRMQVSIMYYAGFLPVEIKHEEEGETGPFGIFFPDGYDAIYSLPTVEGTKYVLCSSVRGCSSCFGTHVSLVRFEDGKFVQDFAFSLDLRSWEEGVTYDPATKTILVKYETDDLTPECGCGEEDSNAVEDHEEITGEESEPVRKRCECRFEFDGKNFVLVKEAWETIK